MGVNLKEGYRLTQMALGSIMNNSPEQRAYLRDIFYYKKSAEIRKVLINDMRLYDCDTADLSRMKPVLINFIPEYIEKICTLYDKPPIFEFGNGSETEQQKLLDLLAEVRINNFFPNNFNLTRLHGTILANVRYHQRTDKVYLESQFNQSNTIVYPYPDYYPEPAIVIYKVDKIYYVWDRENQEHYYLKQEPKFAKDRIGLINTDKYPIDGNTDLKAPDYFPFITYRYRDTGEFWSEGMDELVDIARLVNLLYTVTGDDAIQETIRLLILNFNPTGIEGESGQLKTGLKHPLFAESGIFNEKNNPAAQLVEANLYVESVVKLIEDITDRIANINGISNIIKEQVKSDLSGIAIRLKMQPTLDRHKKDQNVLKYMDMELIKTIVKVNNFHRPEKRIDEGVLTDFQINYQMPEIIIDEAEELATEQAKWEAGVSSPLEYVMRKNPNFTIEEAKTYIQENLALKRELFAGNQSLMKKFNFRTNVE